MKHSFALFSNLVLVGLVAVSCQETLVYDTVPFSGIDDEKQELISNSNVLGRRLKNIDFSFSQGNLNFSLEGGSAEVLILDKSPFAEMGDPEDFFISSINYSDPEIHDSIALTDAPYGYGEVVESLVTPDYPALFYQGMQIYRADAGIPRLGTIQTEKGLYLEFLDRTHIRVTVSKSTGPRIWIVSVRENHPDLEEFFDDHAFLIVQE